MLLLNKKVGETPLEFLDRIRLEFPDLKDKKLSYAGRLDPMAEGQMLVLVGDEENKAREKFLGLDKEYIATFLVGVKTDSGDILGLIEDSFISEKNDKRANNSGREEVEVGELKKATENLKNIKTQKYPWFSGRTVGGVKLFDHFKTGRFDIERPSRKIEVKQVEFINSENVDAEEIKSYIFSSISKVSGDFRQEKILAKWSDFFKNANPQKMQTFQMRVIVSSGTFIRAFTEDFSFPATLLNLKRTKINLI